MKPDSFLKICAAGAAFIAAPFSAMAKAVQMPRVGKGFKVGAGKDRTESPLHFSKVTSFIQKLQRTTRMAIYTCMSQPG